MGPRGRPIENQHSQDTRMTTNAKLQLPIPIKMIKKLEARAQSATE